MNTKIQTGRVYYLDLIKTFSIFLVVFCHIPARDPDSVLTNIFMLLAFTACPLFFLCSGAVMIPSKTWSWSKWRKRLLKTYLSISVWKLLYLLLFHWLNGAACAPAQLVNYLFLFGSLENVDAAHFWFMHAYLVCLLIQPLAWQLWHGGRDGKTALLLAALTAYLGSSYILSPNLITMLLHRLPGLEGFSLAPLMEIRPFGNHSNMLVYFLLGSFLHTLSTGELKSAHSGHTPPLGVLSAIGVLTGLCWLLLAKYHQTGSFRWNGIFPAYGYDHRSILLLSVSLFLLAAGLRPGRAVSLVGANTQGIFYLHIPLLHLMLKYIPTVMILYDSFFVNLLKACAVTALCLILCGFLKRVPLLKKLV